MFAAILSLLPGLALKLVSAYGGAQAAVADKEIEKRKTERDERVKSGDVVMEGMRHKAFWIPWSLAAIPLSAWFGWGVLDSLFNGALPDVATLPPQLKEYADIVWGNIFYVGGGVAGAAIVAGAIARRR